MYEYQVEFKRAVDGDTVDVVVDLGLKCFRAERLRLEGLDTPELSAKDMDARAGAQAARNFVHGRLASAAAVKVQTLKPYPTDKYGRWLAKVFYRLPGETEGTWRCLNDEILAQGLGLPYAG